MKNELIALDNLLCLAPKEEHEAIKIIHALHEKKWNYFYEIRKFNRGEPQNTYKNIDGIVTEIINKIPNTRPSNLFPYPFKIYSNSSNIRNSRNNVIITPLMRFIINGRSY